ncbi:hypothetical protein Lesp01_76860 [Lentzea sp. NBRC 102530]|nr:hypothetical protein Lesp01_76860 [Lentzea sp. NBRC 102530]
MRLGARLACVRGRPALAAAGGCAFDGAGVSDLPGTLGRGGPVAEGDPCVSLLYLGRGWQRGQEYEERFMNGSRIIDAPQRLHGLFSWP